MKISDQRSTRIVITTFCLLVCLGGEVGHAEPPSNLPDFQEDWHVVTLQGQPCGYMHNILRRVGNEIHSKTKTKIEIKRGRATVSIVMEQSTRETLEGKPLSLKSITSLGSVPEIVTGVVQGETIQLTTEQFGVKHESSYSFDPDVKFAWGQLMEQRVHGLKPGTSYTMKTYEPSLRKDGPIEISYKIHGKETVEILGKKKRLCRITGTLKLNQANPGTATLQGGFDIESDIWVDDDLNPLITTVNLGFAKLKTYQTTKEEALRRGAPPEMFLSTLVPVDRRIGFGVKSVKLRLRLKDGSRDRLPTFPSTGMQTFQRINEKEAIITIRRLDWDKIRLEKEIAADGPDLQPYLRSSAVCNAKDSKIKRLARRAVRGHKSPADMADALRKFVTDYIDDKNLDVGFATASEVARNRSGDCTEHGVLLAALARATGFPSRGVTGIVEVPDGYLKAGDEESAFGYHMWTEVYIAGQWVDIDAALRQTDCEPTHIATNLMPLGEEGMMGSITSLIPLLGQLDIQVLEVQR